MGPEISIQRREGFRPFETVARLGGEAFDYDGISGLSDVEFIQRYIGDMNTRMFESGRQRIDQELYRNSVGVKRGVDPFLCSICRSLIQGPSGLRRLSGMALCPSCFPKEWADSLKHKVSNGTNNRKVAAYFNRIVRLNDEIASTK